MIFDDYHVILLAVISSSFIHVYLIYHHASLWHTHVQTWSTATFVYIYMYTCILWINTCIYMYERTCMIHVYEYKLCKYMCIYVYVHARVYITYIYIYLEPQDLASSGCHSCMDQGPCQDAFRWFDVYYQITSYIYRNNL